MARARYQMEDLVKALNGLLRDGKKVDVDVIPSIVRSLEIESRARLAVGAAREPVSVA